MTLKEQISADLIQHMKSSNQLAMDAMRSVKTEFMKMETAQSSVGKTLTDADYLSLIKKLINQRLESKQMYINAGRTDLAEKESLEYDVLVKYLPVQMTENEIKTFVLSKIQENNFTKKDFGSLMKILSLELKNKADGKIVSSIAKNELELL